MKPSYPKLLTAQQFAEATHLHPETVRQWCRQGEVHARQHMTRGRWLIPESEIDRLFPLQELA